MFFPAIKVWGAYLLIIAGISVAGVKLTSHVAGQAVALAQPLWSAGSPVRPSLVEQRRIDAASGLRPALHEAKIRVAAMKASEVSPAVFAAELDRAEKADLPAGARPPRRYVSADDLISFPPAPRTVSLRWKEDRWKGQRRAGYAALRSERVLSRRYPSAAEEFNRRFSSSLADAR